MSDPLPGDAILRPTSRCVIREQEGGYLIYNRESDELHLISPAGFQLFQLCDGLRSVGEIEGAVSPLFAADPGAVTEGVRSFFTALVERGLLEGDPHATH